MDNNDFNIVVDSARPNGGNRCGHDPERPRFFVPPEKHARPLFLKKSITAIRGYYANPAKIFPGLNAVNESERQQRSERREACCAILGAILHYTELVTLRVGIPQPDGSMKGLTVAFLANLAGLDERRAERAIADLKAAGFITVHKVCEKLDDLTYRGLAAIRTVSKHLFTALGLDRWLEHERRRAKERREAKERKRQRKALGNVRLAMSALDNQRRSQAEPETQAERKNGMTHAAEFFANARKTLGMRPKPNTS